jgi:uncharacterized membrane protein
MLIKGAMFPLVPPAPFELAVGGWLVVVIAAAAAPPALRGGFLSAAAQQHAWLAGIAALPLVWVMHSGPPAGPEFGLMGSALFALIFGRKRALLGLLAAVGVHTLLTDGSWLNFGINGTLLAVVPSWLASVLQRLLERLPPNLFIFIIGNGMFVTLLVTAVVSISFVAVAVLSGGIAPHGTADLLAYSLLLAWGEALLSGMIFSALVVFMPGIVLTYRQDIYLPPRKRSF